MRALVVLLLIPFTVFAQDTLMPREGSGWAGFKPGTTVRIKRTFLGQGRTPAVTITTMRLKSVTKDSLVLTWTSRNAVGMEQTQEITVPRKGEAAKGETATTKQLESTTLEAAGKTFVCAGRVITLKNRTGKRVITKWATTQAPRILVKRVEKRYDSKGKQTETISMNLAELARKTTVGKHTVTSLVYTTVHKSAQMTTTSRAVVSRDVPGYEVRRDAESATGGKRLRTVRVEVLSFETK